DADAMGREEIARSARVFAAAPARQQMAGSVEDADVGSACRLRWVLLKLKPAGLESHVAHEGPIVGINTDLHRTPGVRPLLQILAVRRENLNPAVLAISDVDLALAVDGNSVRQIELSRTVSRRAP